MGLPNAHNVGATYCLKGRWAGVARRRSLDEISEVGAPGDGEAAAAARQRVERLADLVRSLAPLDRQLVLLFLEGLEPAELAEVTGLFRTNVTTKVSRIRAALRAHFERNAR